MKDHRFIELLNLYIDRQITVAETAELEAEIQHSPGRQAVYRQYCQIHAATKLVYNSFRANAAEMPTLQPARTGKIEPFETKRGKWQVVYYGAGLAAAACLALVFVRFSPATSADAPLVTARTVVQSAVLPAIVAPAAPVVPAKIMEKDLGLVSLRNSAASSRDYSAMLAALREQDEERAFASGHLQSARVQSLFDDDVFNAYRPMPAQDPKLFRIQQTSAQQVESTVFQFQR